MHTFNEQGIARVKEVLNSSKKIVIVAHKSPDGDSIGSSLGLFHFLTKLGYDVKVCHPDPAPYFLEWMTGIDQIIDAETRLEEVSEHVSTADVIFCLDFNAMSRVGVMKDMMIESAAFKIMIDHHLDPSDEFDLLFSETSSCSTAQLIVDFIEAMGNSNLLDVNIGEPLYCGIMTDSGSFRFPSVTAHTHEVIAQLMRGGVQPYKIHEAVFDTNTFEKLRLRSYAINEKMEILDEFKTAIISLDKSELEQFNYVKGDTEGLVNVGLSITGIKKSIFLTEGDGIIKISFRSKGQNNPVNVMANTYFNGGGHANASGGRWDGNMEEAIAKIKSVLPEFN
ncbi:DHH family phosphoesterase [Brumimicrobium oceani]|uniref:Phosphoesterase n=1 Tax=Brumimicrobium oceani TaxID=2100725 RepID=A0A2U2XHB8_9FLAO|nr:bifunctional oligoribonuclease/PAP phosphatase NrnA [Brumimicrobium oceani]PWH87173.1 phosphoesterase [Brumimicrobium oceani]